VTTWISIRSGEKYDKDNAVWCANPSIWANPYRNRKDFTRDEKCDAYLWYVLSRPDLCVKIPELRGKVLLCWCWPLRCHCETLAWLADSGWFETVSPS
jgi:hypothetical protein